MIISLIAAASTNNVIGKNNQLLWHLPNDMKFFKNTTWAMPVIMGRKTFESFGKGPLPGRFNIVLSTKKDWNSGHSEIKVATNIENAIAFAVATDCKEVFVIGGGKVYEKSIDQAQQIYLTRVHTTVEGDTWFPNINEDLWQIKSQSDFDADEKHAYSYSFQLWTRKTGSTLP